MRWSHLTIAAGLRDECLVSTHVEYPLPITGLVYELQNERQLVPQQRHTEV